MIAESLTPAVPLPRWGRAKPAVRLAPPPERTHSSSGSQFHKGVGRCL